jgi:GntR family transcriptional regulator/MocR family aminotransferase
MCRLAAVADGYRRLRIAACPPWPSDCVPTSTRDLDRQGDRVGEQALAELIEDGELQRHFWRTRRVYRARRDHFVSELRAQLPEWLTFNVPPGGMALWARVRSALPVAAWHEQAVRREVLFSRAGCSRSTGARFRTCGSATAHGPSAK